MPRPHKPLLERLKLTSYDEAEHWFYCGPLSPTREGYAGVTRPYTRKTYTKTGVTLSYKRRTTSPTPQAISYQGFMTTPQRALFLHYAPRLAALERLLPLDPHLPAYSPDNMPTREQLMATAIHYCPAFSLIGDLYPDSLGTPLAGKRRACCNPLHAILGKVPPPQIPPAPDPTDGLLDGPSEQASSIAEWMADWLLTNPNGDIATFRSLYWDHGDYALADLNHAVQLLSDRDLLTPRWRALLRTGDST